MLRGLSKRTTICLTVMGECDLSFRNFPLSYLLYQTIETNHFLFPPFFLFSPHACWSGYFTSRSALKGYIRDSSSVFQASKQVSIFFIFPLRRFYYLTLPLRHPQYSLIVKTNISNSSTQPLFTLLSYPSSVSRFNSSLVVLPICRSRTLCTDLSAQWE